ncbi:MAG: hypothetical protein V3Q69_08485 [Burkholderia sp.]
MQQRRLQLENHLSCERHRKTRYEGRFSNFKITNCGSIQIYRKILLALRVRLVTSLVRIVIYCAQTSFKSFQVLPSKTD